MAVGEKKKRKSFLERLVIIEEPTLVAEDEAAEPQAEELPRMMFARRKPAKAPERKSGPQPVTIRIERPEPEPVVEEIAIAPEPVAEKAAPREIPVRVISEREHERRAAKESYFDILHKAKSSADDEPITRIPVRENPVHVSGAYAIADASADYQDDIVVSEVPVGRTIDPEDLVSIEEEPADGPSEEFPAEEPAHEIRFVVESAEPEPSGPTRLPDGQIVISNISDLADIAPPMAADDSVTYVVESTVPREEIGVSVEHVPMEEIAAFEPEPSEPAFQTPFEIRRAIEKVIFPEQYFYARNGAVIKTFAQLHSALQAMDDETWGHHAIQRGVNDFANWVKHVFEHDECAKLLEAARDRKHMMGLVAEYL